MTCLRSLPVGDFLEQWASHPALLLCELLQLPSRVVFLLRVICCQRVGAYPLSHTWPMYELIRFANGVGLERLASLLHALLLPTAGFCILVSALVFSDARSLQEFFSVFLAMQPSQAAA